MPGTKAKSKLSGVKSGIGFDVGKKDKVDHATKFVTSR